jgi:hypothetical protein
MLRERYQLDAHPDDSHNSAQAAARIRLRSRKLQQEDSSPPPPPAPPAPSCECEFFENQVFNEYATWICERPLRVALHCVLACGARLLLASPSLQRLSQLV